MRRARERVFFCLGVLAGYSLAVGWGQRLLVAGAALYVAGVVLDWWSRVRREASDNDSHG